MFGKKGYDAAGSGSTPVEARKDALDKALSRAQDDGHAPVKEATTHLIGKNREDGSWTASGWCR